MKGWLYRMLTNVPDGRKTQRPARRSKAVTRAVSVTPLAGRLRLTKISCVESSGILLRDWNERGE